MNLSYNVLPQSFQNMRPVALASERAGLHSIAIADSPLISRELFLSCSNESVDKASIRCGIGDSNLV